MGLKQRISYIEGMFMVLVALLYDGIQALIDIITLGSLGWLINPFISLWSFLTFFFWFKLKGISFMKPDKAVSMGAPYLLEIIPILNSLPSITLGVVLMLGNVYAEDVAGSISPQTISVLGPALSKLKKGRNSNLPSDSSTTEQSNKFSFDAIVKAKED